MYAKGSYDFRARTEKARDLMQKHGVDCLYLLPGRNQTYFSGAFFRPYAGWPCWLTPYVLPLEGEPIRVTTKMFESIVSSMPGNILGKRFYTYVDGDEATARKQLQQGLRDLKVERGIIGVEEEIRQTDYELLRSAAPEARIEHVSEKILDPIRMIKDELEIANIRRSSELVDLLLKKAAETIKEGMTNYEIRLELAKCLMEGGADSATIAGTNIFREVQKGDVMDFEPSVKVDGYACEVARTFFVGEPSKEERAIWTVNMTAYDSVEALVRPGVTMHELDMTFKKAMSEGLKDVIPGFISTRKVGHGVGLGPGHEKPYVQQNNMTEAEPGMVFGIDSGPGTGPLKKLESKIDYGYDSRGYGVPIHIISTLLVTKNGFERLDKYTHNITVL